MKIEQAQLNFFESKEHYLTFRDAWKKYINDGKAKKVEQTYWDGTPYRASNLTCAHHLIYALLRGRDITKSFTPNHKVHGQDPYSAFYVAKDDIVVALRFATKFDKPERLESLLEPFDKTITADTLTSLYEIIKEWEL